MNQETSLLWHETDLPIDYKKEDCDQAETCKNGFACMKFHKDKDQYSTMYQFKILSTNNKHYYYSILIGKWFEIPFLPKSKLSLVYLNQLQPHGFTHVRLDGKSEHRLIILSGKTHSITLCCDLGLGWDTSSKQKDSESIMTESTHSTGILKDTESKHNVDSPTTEYWNKDLQVLWETAIACVIKKEVEEIEATNKQFSVVIDRALEVLESLKSELDNIVSVKAKRDKFDYDQDEFAINDATDQKRLFADMNKNKVRPFGLWDTVFRNIGNVHWAYRTEHVPLPDWFIEKYKDVLIQCQTDRRNRYSS